LGGDLKGPETAKPKKKRKQMGNKKGLKEHEKNPEPVPKAGCPVGPGKPAIMEQKQKQTESGGGKGGGCPE